MLLVHTILTWLNAAVTITLVSKIGAATIQSRSPFDTGKRFSSHYFHNQLWAPLSAGTNQGAASNQVNMVHRKILPSNKIWLLLRATHWCKKGTNTLIEHTTLTIGRTCSHFHSVNLWLHEMASHGPCYVLLQHLLDS